ncbi:MAG TPA: thioredoxin-like domain-containing protein [Magnetospirillum sp.]|jgi:thiol-disulfide isomerase/thioredoxin|nr:thioredoxin-like domain-containing protein [Magnetospirillum sp.]
MFGITRAPDFDRDGLTWFNVPGKLTLAELRGRLVVLDFWTFCCVNCYHVHPTLKRLEESLPGELVVIGVHCPKFDHERDPQFLAHAIARYGITHPIVHDPDMVLWDEYGIRAWPTLVFISPDGYVIGELAGEPHPDLLLQGIGDMARQFFARGELKPKPLALNPISEPGGSLRFPGKIKPCPSPDGTKMWALADTGHNQVVVLEDDGSEYIRYGTGEAGHVDGGVEAAFNAPEGLACDETFIYVADTRNHAIRRIDRSTGMVDTLAGLGVRGTILRQPEPGTGAALASPWDIEVVGDALYFANAGSHQIGAIDLATGLVRPAAGAGGESIIDGDGANAQLAQPSGLALAPDGGSLYFADAETSSVRRLRLDSGRVETLVGQGLFDFGHANGALAEAKMQHPLGVAAVDGRVFVADSYNSAIRIIELEPGRVSDLEGLACTDRICRLPAEPAGIAADGPARLLVSDTNNHRVVEYRLDQGVFRTWAE